MLEEHEFCDHCPGCRPVIFDPATGTVLAADSSMMRTVNRIWDHETTYAERKAFMEVTVHNSRSREDLELAGSVVKKLEAAALKSMAS